MKITTKRNIITSLVVLLAPCIIHSAAEAEQDRELLETIALSAREYAHFLENQHQAQRLLADAQNESEDDSEEERKENIAFDPLDVSSNEDERPERRLDGIHYDIYNQHPEIAALIRNRIPQVNDRLEQAITKHNLPAEDIADIRNRIDNVARMPFKHFTLLARHSAATSALDAANGKINELNAYIKQQIRKQKMVRLTNATVDRAQETIRQARLITHFPEENIAIMEQEVNHRLTVPLGTFQTMRNFNTSISRTDLTLQEQLNAGKATAAIRAIQIREELKEQQAQFASDMSGMGGFY